MLNASQRRVNKNSLTWWYILKTSWRYLCKTSWRRLEDGLKTSWQAWRCYQNVLKTSSEDVTLRRTYSSWSRRLQDVFIKTNVCWVHCFYSATRWNLRCNTYDFSFFCSRRRILQLCRNRLEDVCNLSNSILLVIVVQVYEFHEKSKKLKKTKPWIPIENKKK